jgi:hypothetical protein
MNISGPTIALAEQLPIHIADAGTARSGPSVNTYEEGLHLKKDFNRPKMARVSQSPPAAEKAN